MADVPFADSHSGLAVILRLTAVAIRKDQGSVRTKKMIFLEQIETEKNRAVLVTGTDALSFALNQAEFLLPHEALMHDRLQLPNPGFGLVAPQLPPEPMR